MLHRRFIPGRLFSPHRYFLDGVPAYLARHYWWAYLWPAAVWFFDHQPIINAILFGQYRKLMAATLARIEGTNGGPILQLTCVYGALTPKLLTSLQPQPLHLADVATIQLELARRKTAGTGNLLAARMNVGHMAYGDDSFATVVLFFLLHEMPEAARANVLSECMRVIRPGGMLLVTEYAPRPKRHFLYRFRPARWLLTTLEPFLAGFWLDDLSVKLDHLGAAHAKRAEILSDVRIFGDFYRVTEFRIREVGE